jgi:hypothetical protein
VLGLVAGSAAIAAGPDDVLKSRGLTRSGMLYVLDAEAGFLDRVGKLQPSYQQLKGLYENLFAIMQNQAEYDELDRRWTLVNERLGNVRAEIGAHPPLSNNVLRQHWYDLLESEKQLLFQWNELNREVNLRYKKLIPDWKKENLTNDFQKRRGDFLKETRDLHALVDKIKGQYGVLSKDDAVQKALVALRTSTKSPLDLGPSPEFKKKSDWLIRAERGTAPENFPRKVTRKKAQNDRPIRGGPKSKRNDAPASGTPAPRPK